MTGWENFKPGKRAQDPATRLRNTQSRHLGAEFEAYIKSACEHYRAAGIAKIEKTPERLKVLYPLPNNPGRFVACFEAAAQPDFKGLLRGGREVCFEAKATITEQIKQSAVTEDQTTDLNEHFEFGAVCFVMVSFGMRSFYRVPWVVWRSMKERFGRKYATEQELTQYAVPVKVGRVMFLDGLNGGYAE